MKRFLLLLLALCLIVGVLAGCDELTPPAGETPGGETPGTGDTDADPNDKQDPDLEVKPGEDDKTDPDVNPGEDDKTDPDVKPGENDRPGTDVKPGEDDKPGTDVKPGENDRPGTDVKPGEDDKPGTDVKPGEDDKPGTDVKPGEDDKPGTATVLPGVPAKDRPAFNTAARTEITEAEWNGLFVSGKFQNYTMWADHLTPAGVIDGTAYALMTVQDGKIVGVTTQTLDGMTGGYFTFIENGQYYSAVWNMKTNKWTVRESSASSSGDSYPLVMFRDIPYSALTYVPSTGMYQATVGGEHVDLRFEDGICVYINYPDESTAAGMSRLAVWLGDYNTTTLTPPPQADRETAASSGDSGNSGNTGGSSGINPDKPPEPEQPDPPSTGESKPPITADPDDPNGGGHRPGDKVEPNEPEEDYGIAVGDRLRPFTVRLENDESFDLHKQQLDGNVTIINFFATWCPPCMAELPALDALATKYADQVAILALHTQMGSEDLSTLLEGDYADSDILFGIDWGDKLYLSCGDVNAVPFTVIVDANGIIRYSFTGAKSESEWESMIKTLI